MGDDLFSQNESVRDILFTIEDKIKNGLFSQSIKYFDMIIEIDNEYPLLYERLACIKFWINRESTILSYKDKGLPLSTLLSSYYKLFSDFIRKYEIPEDTEIIVSIKAYVFNSIVEILEHEYKRTGSADILKDLCYALIGIGQYKKAIDGLEYLRERQYLDGHILSNLALANEKISNIKMSKFYIREVLFYDPLNIDNALLRDNIYIKKIREVMFNSTIQISSEQETQLWLGVYGEIYNILDVRRSLSPKEIIVLRKMISRFEADYKRRNLMENTSPRLFLAYIRLALNLLLDSKKNVDEIEFIIKKMDMLNTRLTRIFVENINI